VRCVNENRKKRKRLRDFHAKNANASQDECSVKAVATMIGCLPTQALAFFAFFVYATQAIAFEWKPGFSPLRWVVLAQYWQIFATLVG